MKRCLLVLYSMCLAVALLARTEDKAPTIIFDAQSKDFGKATEGEVLKHVFRFKNKGSAPLVIDRVDAT